MTLASIIRRDGENKLLAAMTEIDQLRTLETPALLVAAVAWNPPNILAGGYTSTTITVTGAEPGDLALASHDQIGAADVIVSAHVQAVDTVRVVIFNPTAGAINIAAGDLTVNVWKRGA